VSNAQFEYFLCVIGMVFVIEGLPYFGFPEKMKQMMLMMIQQDDRVLRMMGAVLMIMGLLIVYIARGGLGSI
jgi:uncharacterized protein